MEVRNEFIKVTLCAVLFCVVAAVEYSEKNEGYALGFMPICPGSWKPAEIKPEHLNMIKISVLSNGTLFEAKWTSYNYHNIGNLAKHPEVDFRRKTLLYVPGYMEFTALPLGRNLGEIYKALGYNVLIVDYLGFTTNVFPIATRLMRPVGKHVAEMIASLTTLGLDPKKLELVGLSLGGATLAIIAKNYRQITGRNISSLTALDPTGPCFRQLGSDQRLDPSDADFVLSIATNMAGYGISTPVGQVQVYVNGGSFQPGAFPSFLCDNLCSHLQAYFIWMSALQRPGAFIAMKCDSVQQARDHNCFDRKPMVTNTLDLYTDRSKPGIYYLSTRNTYPYYLGRTGLKRRGVPFLRHLSSVNAVDVMRV